MSAQPATEIDLVTPVLPGLALASRARTATSNTESDWLCSMCLHRVASERDRFPYDGKDEFTFSNPEGLRFEIITFSQTLGCLETGAPTLEHTWFAGHVWSFCHCTECGQHVGWYYAGEHHFVGLIKERIKRALLISN